MSKTTKKVRSMYRNSLPEAVINDVVAASVAVGNKVDDLTDPVTEPVVRGFKKIGSSISDKRLSRRAEKAVTETE